MGPHQLESRRFKRSDFAPGQQAIVYKSTQLPRQISEGFLIPTADFVPSDLTNGYHLRFHWSPDFCTHYAPFVSIATPSCTPRLRPIYHGKRNIQP